MDWIKIAGYRQQQQQLFPFYRKHFYHTHKRHKRYFDGMYIVYVFGIVMWLTYGIGIKDLPIILQIQLR